MISPSELKEFETTFKRVFNCWLFLDKLQFRAEGKYFVVWGADCFFPPLHTVYTFSNWKIKTVDYGGVNNCFARFEYISDTFYNKT